jgi:outer membrane protein assembly factor BamB
MPTPGRYNYFELSFKIIVILMVLAISITMIVLTVNDARHSHPIVKHTASKSAFWEKAGFYIWSEDRNNGQQIVALNNKVILNNDSRVVALDGQTGRELWTYRGGSVGGLAISSTTVFVGAEYVTALDVEIGDVLWSTRMPHGRGATTLHIQGDTLYADDGSLLYQLLNTQTGEALEWGRFRDGKFPPSDIFPARELQAAHSLFGIDTVIGNIGYWGSIRGVSVANIPNGNILWRYEIPLISPIAVSGKSIYAISENGKLMRFDPATGAASVMISYTPAPLARLTEEEADGLYHNFVASDPTSNMVYVYLGDSETLMAYQLYP